MFFQKNFRRLELSHDYMLHFRIHFPKDMKCHLKKYYENMSLTAMFYVCRFKKSFSKFRFQQFTTQREILAMAKIKHKQFGRYFVWNSNSHYFAILTILIGPFRLVALYMFSVKPDKSLARNNNIPFHHQLGDFLQFRNKCHLQFGKMAIFRKTSFCPQFPSFVPPL